MLHGRHYWRMNQSSSLFPNIPSLHPLPKRATLGSSRPQKPKFVQSSPKKARARKSGGRHEYVHNSHTGIYTRNTRYQLCTNRPFRQKTRCCLPSSNQHIYLLLWKGPCLRVVSSYSCHYQKKHGLQVAIVKNEFPSQCLPSYIHTIAVIIICICKSSTILLCRGTEMCPKQHKKQLRLSINGLLLYRVTAKPTVFRFARTETELLWTNLRLCFLQSIRSNISAWTTYFTHSRQKISWSSPNARYAKCYYNTSTRTYYCVGSCYSIHFRNSPRVWKRARSQSTTTTPATAYIHHGKVSQTKLHQKAELFYISSVVVFTHTT